MINTSKISCDITDYKELIEKGCFYCDKTSWIEFFREKKCVSIPVISGIGTSLFCSTLYYYYDINSINEYDYLFKNTYIYNRFDDHNKYYVIKINCLEDGKMLLNEAIKDFRNRYPRELLPSFFTSFFIPDSKELDRYIDKLFIIVDNATKNIIYYIDDYLKKINPTAKVFITKPNDFGVSVLSFTSQNLLDYLKSIDDKNYQELTNQILDYLGYDIISINDEVVKVVNTKLAIEYIDNYYNNDKPFTYYDKFKDNLISYLDKIKNYSMFGAGNNYLKYLLIDGDITREKYNRETLFNYNILPYSIKMDFDTAIKYLIRHTNGMFKENVIKYRTLNYYGRKYQEPEEVKYRYPKIIRRALLDYLLLIITRNNITINKESVNEVITNMGETGDITTLIENVFKNQYKISERIKMVLDREYIFLMIMLYFHISDIPVDFESRDNAIIIKKNKYIKYNIIISSILSFTSKIINELNVNNDLQRYLLKIEINDNYFKDSYTIKKYCDNKYEKIITKELTDSEEND